MFPTIVLLQVCLTCFEDRVLYLGVQTRSLTEEFMVC